MSHADPTPAVQGRVRTYKYRAYPTPHQVEALEAWLGFACGLYNAALQTQKDPWARRQRHRFRFWDGEREEWVWRDARPPVAGHDPNGWGSELTRFRQEHADLLPEGMPALVQHEVLARVKRTTSAITARAAAGKKAGTPRYRNAGRYDSLTFGLTAPSRPPAERDEAWQAEHVHELERSIEHIVDQVAAGRRSVVTPKELRELLGVTTAVARSLRVLALTHLGYEVPHGVTVGAGTYRDGVLRLTGLGEVRLERHREMPEEAVARTATVLRSCGRWYVAISADLPAVDAAAVERPAVGLDMGVIQWCTAFTDDRDAALRLAVDLKRMATDPADRRRLWAAERHARRLRAAAAHWAALGERPPYHCGATAARRARQARRRHARVLFRLRQIEARMERLRKRLAATGRASTLVQDEAGAAVLIEGAHAGPRHARRVARTQRRLARRTRRGHSHSHRRKKAVAGYARAKEREASGRRDHRHKVSRALVRQFGDIHVEDLAVRKLTVSPKNDPTPEPELPAGVQRRLNNRILDQAWYELRATIGYKAEDAGGRLVLVPAEYTTQMCSQCGTLVPKPPTLRVHRCPACGYAAPRTVNSARNVLQHSLEQPGRAGPSGANRRGSPHAVA